MFKRFPHSSIGKLHCTPYAQAPILLFIAYRPQDIHISEDPLPADRIFDAIALRLSAYALHETSYRLVPTGMD